MAFCTKCGSKLNDGAVFCGQCGAKVFLAQHNRNRQIMAFLTS